MSKLLQWMGWEPTPEVLATMEETVSRENKAFILHNETRELLDLPPVTLTDNFNLGVAEILYALALKK